LPLHQPNVRQLDAAWLVVVSESRSVFPQGS
jgi:hypothetical protein